MKIQRLCSLFTARWIQDKIRLIYEAASSVTPPEWGKNDTFGVKIKQRSALKACDWSYICFYPKCLFIKQFLPRLIEIMFCLRFFFVSFALITFWQKLSIQLNCGVSEFYLTLSEKATIENLFINCIWLLSKHSSV